MEEACFLLLTEGLFLLWLLRLFHGFLLWTGRPTLTVSSISETMEHHLTWEGVLQMLLLTLAIWVGLMLAPCTPGLSVGEQR